MPDTLTEWGHNMSETLYEMDDDARLYVFAASRDLTGPEIEMLNTEIRSFIAGWQAHKERVAAAYEWKDNRFLMIAIDESVTPLSGCSIDNLVRTMRGFEARLDVTFVDGEAVYFRCGGGICRAGRSDFKDMFRKEQINLDTIVFNTTIDRLADLRSGHFEVPLRSSWHVRLIQAELAGT